MIVLASITLNPKTKKYDVQFRVKDAMGNCKKSTKRGFKRKSDAKKWLNEYELKKSENLSMKFSDYVDVYLEDLQPRLRKTTYETKRTYLRVHITPFFGNYGLDDISVSMVRKWQNQLIERGYSETYQKTLNNQLSALFNHAVAYYGLKNNPVRIAGPIGKEHGDEVEFYTKEEFDRLIEQTMNNQTVYTIFMTFYWTGMRLGELRALTPNDIHIDEKYIDVNKSLQVVKGKEIITDPKTPKSKRRITIPDFLATILKEYMDSLYNPNPNKPIFRMSKGAIHHALKTSAVKAGLKPLRIHAFRHAHAAYLIEMQVPILAISNRLGHEKIQTTMNTYGHLYPNKQRQIADAIEARVKGEF